MKAPISDDDLHALIARAFSADTPPPPPVGVTVARAVRHAHAQRAPAWPRGRPAQVGWAAAGLLALVIGSATGAASGAVAFSGELDFAFGAPPITGDLDEG